MIDSSDPFAQLAERQNAAPSERVLSAIQREIKEDNKARQSLSRGQRVGLSVLALALGFTLTSMKVVSASPSAFAIALATSCLSIGALLMAGAVPGNARFQLGGRRFLLAGLGVAFISSLAFMANEFLGFDSFLKSEHLKPAIHCASFSFMAGLIASSGLMVIWKRTDPFSPGLTGALLGFLGGLMGSVSVSLSCHADEGLHLTLGHGFGAFLIAGLAALLGRRWLRP